MLVFPPFFNDLYGDIQENAQSRVPAPVLGGTFLLVMVGVSAASVLHSHPCCLDFLDVGFGLELSLFPQSSSCLR